MQPIEENKEPSLDFDNSKSYVKLELGKAGAIEISVKAGDDATVDIMEEKKNLALDTIKAIMTDEVISKHVKKPKLDPPF